MGRGNQRKGKQRKFFLFFHFNKVVQELYSVEEKPHLGFSALLCREIKFVRAVKEE